MDAEHDFDQALAGWGQTLLQMEAAVQAADWQAACRLGERNSRQFDRLRELVEQSGLVPSGNREQTLRQGVATLQRLAGLFEVWQRQFKTEVQHRRRSLQTARTYHPVSVPGPQHVRVYAGLPPAR